MRQRRSNFSKMSSFNPSETNFLLANMMSIFAFSNVERRAMLRNWINSFFDVLPLPSAILFGIDKPAPLNFSAKRNSFFFSSSSAISNNILAIYIANFHISKSSNLNFVFLFLSTIHFLFFLFLFCYSHLALRPMLNNICEGAFHLLEVKCA